jgi:large subunit ribosomal protein L4
MPTVPIYNTKKEEVGSLDLSAAIFGTEVREHLFYEAVRYQLAKRRAGTHATKSRSRISGGGKKPYRQKGTGRARQGTTRAVHWRGGGVVHGPHPRTHNLQMNKKARHAALCAALSRRVEEKAVTIFDAFELPEKKTKLFIKIMDDFEFGDLLLVTEDSNENALFSSRNLPKVTVIPVEGLNVYDILKHRNLAFTKGAVDKVTKRLEK